MATGDIAGGPSGFGFNWPIDEDGKPMALVGFQCSELVPTVQYGNCSIGPALAYRFAEDTEKGRREGIKQCAKDVETILGEERNTVLQVIQAQRIKAAQEN